MTPARQARILGPATVVLAFVGLWVSHTLAYLGMGGSRGLAQALLSSVHLYMLPLGFALAALAGVLGARCWSTWLALGARLEEARAALARAWRGSPLPATRRGRHAPGSGRPASPRPAPAASPGRSRPLLAAWLTLAAIQLGLYLIQENTEARVLGLPLPGLGPVSGRHSPALLIHLAVALVLAAGLTWIGRRIEKRGARLEACERLVREVLQRRFARVSFPERHHAGAARTPLAIFGPQLWSRPPPAILSTTAS